MFPSTKRNENLKLKKKRQSSYFFTTLVFFCVKILMNSLQKKKRFLWIARNKLIKVERTKGKNTLSILRITNSKRKCARVSVKDFMITKAAKVGGWFALFSSIASLFDLLFVKKYISHVSVVYAPYVYQWPRTLQLVLTLLKKNIVGFFSRSIFPYLVIEDC